MLGRFWFRLLLFRGLGLLLSLLLLALRLRGSLLLFRCGLLGFFFSFLLLTTGRLTPKLELHKILSDGDGILFIDQELLDSTSFRCVHGNVNLSKLVPSPDVAETSAYLVRFDGGNLLVDLDVVTDLCKCISKPSNFRLESRSRFDHCFKVPSVMDSAICGTLTTVSATENVSIWISEKIGGYGTVGSRLRDEGDV